MTTLLLTHPACLDHRPGPHHPERPERLSAILQVLDGESFKDLARAEAPLATTEQLTRVHPANYVQAMLGAKPAAGEYAMIDGDTILSHG
ncbi:MAG TPA: histone deacetylase family protein, partial [Reyranella sp.]|nr:histone deacetylase family protein [Reyranella sp.]